RSRDRAPVGSPRSPRRRRCRTPPSPAAHGPQAMLGPRAPRAGRCCPARSRCATAWSSAAALPQPLAEALHELVDGVANPAHPGARVAPDPLRAALRLFHAVVELAPHIRAERLRHLLEVLRALLLLVGRHLAQARELGARALLGRDQQIAASRERAP